MTGSHATQERVLIGSSDTHVAPPLAALREYCSPKHLDDFDGFIAAYEQEKASRVGPSNESRLLPNPGYSSYGFTEEQIAEAYRAAQSGPLRNAQSVGTYDMSVREADMDFDGVACEIAFHGSQNEHGFIEPLPFASHGGPVGGPAGEFGRATQQRELTIEGCWMFNRWLADFCGTDTQRHSGVCQVPIWDLDESIRIVKWAADHGIRSVNFPSPQLDLPPYEAAVWDSFFSVCADLRMPLSTHIGTTLPPLYTGPAAFGILIKEAQLSGPRNLWHLTFSGVFDRHPELRLVLTEIAGDWWVEATQDMDDIYCDPCKGGPALRGFLKHEPSYYVRNNVYLGVSFMAPHEAQSAVSAGLVGRVMWGSDYPHSEGTWLYFADDDPDRFSTTRLSLANTFAGLDEDQIRKMAGLNFVECFGLDRNYLAGVAARIGPTIDDLMTRPDEAAIPPVGYVGRGFRSRSCDSANSVQLNA